METKTFENAVKKVVAFWVEKSFRTLLNQNNGDDSPQGGMTFLLMNMLAMQSKQAITEEQIKLFEEELTKLLMMHEDNPHNCELNVDYHPCPLLRYAADHAKIDYSVLPCKTYTTIRPDFTALGAFQYGGKLIEL